MKKETRPALPTPSIPPRMADLVDTAAGCVGATACTLGGLPFDVAKARLQAGGAGHAYSGLADCLLTTARTEGALALYRGMVPALSSALAENSVGITVQRSLRRALGVDDGGQRPSVGTELGLGAVTGVFTSVAICPFEVLKVRLQLNHDLVDAGPAALLRELRSLVGSEGLSGLYRGIGSLVCRDVPYNTLFYGAAPRPAASFRPPAAPAPAHPRPPPLQARTSRSARSSCG